MKPHLAPKSFNPPPVPTPVNLCGIAELSRRVGMGPRSVSRYLTDLHVEPVAQEVCGSRVIQLWDLRATLELLKFRPEVTVTATH